MLTLARGANIAQVVPQRIDFEREPGRHPGAPAHRPAAVRIGEAARKKLPLTRPGEMILLELSAGQIRELKDGMAEREVRVECE